jgi:hypothetical protein
VFKKILFAIAMAFTSVVAAQANDRPTDNEILKAAQAQGIHDLKAASGLPTEPGAWSVKSVLVDFQAPDGENTYRAFAQIEAGSDLFIEARKHEGKTLVTPTFQTGSSTSIPGKVHFKRVGLFTRTWEIKFAWENTMPPGLTLPRFTDAVSTQSDEGRALSQVIAHSIEAEIQRNVAAAEAKTAAFAKDRAAAEKRMAQSVEQDGTDIVSALEGFVGKWIPYTILTPTNDPNAPTSDFRAVRIDSATGGEFHLTLLLGSHEGAKQAKATAAVSDGMLRYADSDGCQVELAPSRKQNREVYMLFGSRFCSVARQHVSIVLEERTPKQVAEFVARMTNPIPPAEAKQLLPLPPLKP